MGLTLFTFLTVIVIFSMTFIVRSKGRHYDIFFFRLATLLSGFYCLLQAIAFLILEDHPEAGLLLARLAGSLEALSYLAFLRLALSFPNNKRLSLANFFFVVISAFIIWRFVGTEEYLENIRKVFVEIIIFEGNFYMLFSLGTLGLGVIASAVLWLRNIKMASRISRQQLFLVASSILVSVIYVYLVSIYFPSLGFTSLYPINGLGSLIAILATAYAFSSSRLYHIPSIGKTVVSQVLMVLMYGIPMALIVAVLYIFRFDMRTMVLLLGTIVFLVFGIYANRYADRRFGAARNERAREELIAAIAHLDLASGREAVLDELSGLLLPRFGSQWFWMLSENDEGGLNRVYPDKNEITLIASGADILEILGTIESRVLLKSEVSVEPALAQYRDMLIGFFESIDAEVLILAKEGRRIIGMFVIGPKITGADYSALDYEAFQAIHGKLFVVAYYVKHVAREALLETVEKEVALADQIITSVQENVNSIAHKAVDAAHICQSARSLGGDLYDSVKLSEHRWFFVVGDVSGKGLNAAMSMIILKSMIRTLLRDEKDFVKLVSRTNNFIKDHLPRGTFFAGIFAFLALDKRSLYFINCGIPAIFFKSPGLDTIIEVQGEGKMLGIIRNLDPFLKTRKLALPPGSSMVISTDGIVEAENVRGERYGKERLVRILSENTDADAQTVIDSVIKSASSFTDGKLEDDVTLLAINFLDQKGGKR